MSAATLLPGPLPWQHGQWAQFQQARARDRLPQAYLLTGPEGVGKWHLASAMGAALLCDTPIDAREDRAGAACGTCRRCRFLAQGTHPDLWQPPDKRAADEAVVGAGAITRPNEGLTVDAVRQITRFFTQTAQFSGMKVALLPQVDSLLPAAANALLKTLEEPPPNTLLLLTTAAPGRVLPTIHSRCQRLRCAAPAPTDAATDHWLAGQLAAVGVSREAASLLGLTHGAPLAALALAHQWETRQQFFAELAQVIAGERDPFEWADSWGKSPAVTADWLLSWCDGAIVHRLAQGPKPRPFCRRPLAAWWQFHGGLLAWRQQLGRSVNGPLQLIALLHPLLTSGDAHV